MMDDDVWIDTVPYSLGQVIGIDTSLLDEKEDKVIPLSLSRNYVSNWGITEAIRELIANALDTGDYEIDIEGNTLTIETYGGSIPTKHLLMGSGSKSATTDDIGQFNEGMKLALLILEREGVDLEILNGDKIWIPSFEYSELFEEECLHITECENTIEDMEGVRFILRGLDTELLEQVEANNLVFHPDREIYTTPQGEILLDDEFKGKIYCGGIWVANEHTFDYGYNFNVGCLTLDRDRQTIKTFDIKWQTKEMWQSISENPSEGQVNEIVDNLENSKADTEYFAAYTCVSSKVADKACESFIEEFGDDAIVTNDYQEADKLKASGYRNVNFINNETLVKVIKASNNYKTVDLNIEIVKPMDLLLDFEDKWCNNMDIDMSDAYQEMLVKLEKLI